MPNVVQVRVYYEDTDAIGYVYHSRYLNFAERGRTEWLRACGFDATRLMDRHGLCFVVSELSVKFLGPARMDDLLHIRTHLLHVKSAQCRLRQTIMRDQTCLADLTCRLAMINREGKPKPFPKDVVSIFHHLPTEV